MLLVAACSRNKDPYADMKPGQLLDEGERLLRVGDLDGADKAFRLGLERLENVGLNVEKTRPAFVKPLFHLAVKRGKLADAEKLLPQMGSPVDVRGANQVAVMVHRTGKIEEARARGEVVAVAVAAHPPANEEDRAVHVAAWITVDRLRSARFDRAGAKEASDAVAAGLMDIAENRGVFRPLPPGLRAWMSRYIDHLFATDRDTAAKEVAALVERIDENAPPPEHDALCIPLYSAWQNLGCLLEIEP
jgi:hypothetical protein